jgi:hypothetical protein
MMHDLSTQTARVERRLTERRTYLRELLAQPCAHCGEKYPIGAMNFHHRDPAQKRMKVGEAARNWNDETFYSEVAKCDVVCANCHAIEHAPLWKAE